MWRRVILGLSASVVLASWGICAISYATRGGGAYNGGLFAIFILGAGILTIWAAMLVVSAWTGEAAVLVAAPVSILAAASILWLALAIGLRG
jgi:hypothetical protein